MDLPPADAPIPVHREILDWRAPILPSVARWLLDWTEGRMAPGGPAGAESAAPNRRAGDASGVLCVVPGRRAGRLLLRALLDAVDPPEALLPPRTLTPRGLLPTVAAWTDLPPMATDAELLAASLGSVVAADPRDAAVLSGTLASMSDPPWRFRFEAARRLVRLEQALAAGGFRPEDVAPPLDAADRPDEAERWRCVVRLAEGRRARLHAAGLSDPFAPQALADADVEPMLRPSLLVLVGIAELAAPARAAVAALARTGVPIVAMIRADPAHADRFDELGLVRPDAWARAAVAPPDAVLRVARDVVHHAELVRDAIGAAPSGVASDDVLLGLADPATAGSIGVAARDAGAEVHDAAGRRLGDRQAWRLLDRLVAWRRERRASDLAALVRAPRFEARVADALAEAVAAVAGVRSDVGVDVDAGEGEGAGTGTGADAGTGEPAAAAAPASTTQPATIVADIDRVMHERLPERLAGARGGRPPWRAERPAEHRQFATFQAAAQAADAALAPLVGPARPLHEWARPLGSVIAELNADRRASVAAADGGGAPGASGASGASGEADDDDDWTALADAADVIGGLDPELGPALDGVDALELLLAATGDRMVPVPASAAAIEMTGLLEVPLDPAPVLVVAGVHDAVLPSRPGRDALLPESTRRLLDLATDAQRAGVDAYLLESALAGREHARVIAMRRVVDGGPAIPSRLLLRVPPDDLPQRVGRLVGVEIGATDAPGAGRPDNGAPEAAVGPEVEPAARADPDRFVVPPLPPVPVPERLRVTAFRRYLQCPYRFALEHLLEARAVEPDPRELSAGAFGDVVHDVLARFGTTAAADAGDDVAAVEAALSTALEATIEDRFAGTMLPAVRLQLDRIRHRLAAFAPIQASFHAEGWRVLACERPIGDVSLDLGSDEAPMPIRGTIDRIDRHVETGAWRIIDYKTGSAGTSADRAHLKGVTAKSLPAADDRDAWVDLQLPLYRHLLRRAEVDGQVVSGSVEVGYVVLPSAATDVAWTPATWTPDHQATAIEVARDIVRHIRNGDFPLNADAGGPFDAYAWMLGRAHDLVHPDGAGAATADDDASPGRAATGRAGR